MTWMFLCGSAGERFGLGWVWVGRGGGRGRALYVVCCSGWGYERMDGLDDIVWYAGY